jgi:hypothetical protein
MRTAVRDVLTSSALRITVREVSTKRKPNRDDGVIVTFRTTRGLVRDYRKAIKSDHPTVSDALRTHMAAVVADAETEPERQAA